MATTKEAAEQRASAEEQRKAKAAAELEAAAAAAASAARPRTLPSLRNKPKACVRMRAVCDIPNAGPALAVAQLPEPKGAPRLQPKGSAPSGTAPSSAAPSKTASVTTAHGTPFGASSGHAPAAAADGAGASSARPLSADAPAKVHIRGRSRPSSGPKSGAGGSGYADGRRQTHDSKRPQSAPVRHGAAGAQRRPSFDEFAELEDESEASDCEEFEMQLALQSDAEGASLGLTDEGAHSRPGHCFPVPCWHLRGRSSVALWPCV